VRGRGILRALTVSIFESIDFFPWTVRNTKSR
jgi:hypothetical protein